ncbi:MAG: hypothetical protein C4293_18715 [Nitrospiraceae bacterium]
MVVARNKTWGFVAVVFLLISTLSAETGRAEKLWFYELRDAVIFYQAHYPEGNWYPYIEKLNLVKEDLDRGDRQLLKTAMDDFLTMLRSGAHGINSIAAHALYWIALGLHSDEPYTGDRSRHMESGSA